MYGTSQYKSRHRQALGGMRILNIASSFPDKYGLLNGIVMLFLIATCTREPPNGS